MGIGCRIAAAAGTTVDGAFAGGDGFVSEGV
jgi:hypothetical protein